MGGGGGNEYYQHSACRKPYADSATKKKTKLAFKYTMFSAHVTAFSSISSRKSELFRRYCQTLGLPR